MMKKVTGRLSFVRKTLLYAFVLEFTFGGMMILFSLLLNSFPKLNQLLRVCDNSILCTLFILPLFYVFQFFATLDTLWSLFVRAPLGVRPNENWDNLSNFFVG